MVPEGSENNGQSSSGSTAAKFCLSEITKGDEFAYWNGSTVVCGCIGEIESHDGGTVHVVSNSMGDEICVIRGDAGRIALKGRVIVPLGERASFSFVPSYPLSS